MAVFVYRAWQDDARTCCLGSGDAVFDQWQRIVTHENLGGLPRVRALFDHLVEAFTLFIRREPSPEQERCYLRRHAPV